MLSQAVTLSLTYSDTGGSGVKDCRYTNDGTLDTEPWEACTPTKSWTLTSGQGLRTVHYQVRDNAGNTYETSDRIVANSICNSASSLFYCCVRDSCQTGEADMFHMYDTQNSSAEILPQNNYPYKMCCGAPGISTDCNMPEHGTLFKLQGITNSLIEKSTLANYPNRVCMHSSAGNITCGYSSSSCTDLGPDYLCIATMSADTNAHVSDCDGVNDYSIKVCCEFRDQTPPVTTITPDGAPWAAQDVQFSLSCSDVGGSCSTRYYKIMDDGQDCGASGFSTGATGYVTCDSASECAKRVCYYSVDDSGNQESVKASGIFRIDKKPPATTDNSDDSWHGGSVTVTLDCSDTGSGCKDTYYCIYSEGGAQCSPSTKGNAAAIQCQGTCRNKIRYYSTDNTGNLEPAKDSKTIKIDTALPSCTLLLIGDYRNSSYFPVSWTASGASLTGVTIQNSESGGWADLTTSQQASGTFNFTGGQNGHTYNFRCVARNALGNETSSLPVDTMVDTQPPSASIQAQPYANATSFAVSWSGSDSESGIAGYAVRYKAGASEYSSWSTDPQSASAVFGQDGLPLPLQNNVTYRLKATAMDRAGNARESSELPVMVDTGKPSCSIQDLPASQPSSDFTVSWSGSDGESGIMKFVVEQRTGSVWSQLYSGPDASKEILNAQDGIYRFRCRSVDNANNLGELSPEKNTTVDMNPPDAQINFSSAVYVNDNLNVNAVITDSIRVSKATLFYNNNVVDGTASQNPNYSVWNVTWTISNLVSTGMKTFTISVQDVDGNSRNYTSQFLVALCAPGEVQNGCRCGTGTKTCRTDGTWGECTNVTKQPRPEVCDGDDNDCNGFVDDVNSGTSIQSTKCQCYNSDLLSASAEACDGIDNNCNGQIDENGNCCNNGDTQPCGSDVGICKSKNKICSGGLWGPCEWQQGPNPGGETCGNNLDDNCDGQVDENCGACTDMDADGYGSPASSQCAYPGLDCDDADLDANPGTPEVCDGKDNNCDGQIDEGLDCQSCSNGIQDASEDGVDCGGSCPACFVWGWLFLTAGGIAILLILLYVWLHMKRQGRELTWEELNKKWAR